MIILNMAKFRRQRELGKHMCGWVVPALVESRAKDESGENQPPLATIVLGKS